MAFAFNKQHPEWTTAQQLWILGQVDEDRTQRQIFDELSAEQSATRPEDAECWDGSFSAFKKRLQRLTKNGIDPAIDTDTGQKFDFDLATARGRYDYWVWLAKTTTAQGTRTQALQMIEKLAPQFGGETGDGHNLLSNPRNVKLDAGLVTELVMTFRGEIGGLHKLPLDALNQQELKSLVKEASRVYAQKSDADDLHAVLDGIERKGETRDQKLFRLRQELEGLTEDEIRDLESESFMKVEDSDEQ